MASALTDALYLMKSMSCSAKYSARSACVPLHSKRRCPNESVGPPQRGQLVSTSYPTSWSR